MNLTIPRSLWCCGQNFSYLVNADGSSCILGHVLLNCGYAPELLTGKANVAQFAEDHGLVEEVLAHPVLSQLVKICGKVNPYLFRSDFAQIIADINDFSVPHNAEINLTREMRWIGVEVEFVS